MDDKELLQIIKCGESSIVQFKERMPHPDSFAQELIAFSNSKGGIIVFGVNDKTGGLNGLSFGEIQHLNQQIVNIASQKIYPPVYINTETVAIDNNQLLVIIIEEGLSKPYKDSNGTIYLKNGSDKRKVTSNNEIARLLGSKSLLAEEMEIYDSSIKDLNVWLFSEYFKKEFGMTYEEKGLTLEEALIAKKVMRNNQIALFASKTLPYSGLGSGMRRAFSEQPDMELKNDVDGEQFIVCFPRRNE